MLALCEPGDRLGVDALPPDVRHPAQAERPAPAIAEPLTTLDSMTVAAMREALEATQGNVSLAARRLGVSRSTLYRRLQGNA